MERARKGRRAGSAINMGFLSDSDEHIARVGWGQLGAHCQLGGGPFGQSRWVGVPGKRVNLVVGAQTFSLVSGINEHECCSLCWAVRVCGLWVSLWGMCGIYGWVCPCKCVPVWRVDHICRVSKVCVHMGVHTQCVCEGNGMSTRVFLRGIRGREEA